MSTLTGDSAGLERRAATETRIRFRDCDVFGHLHNTRYGDYFMDAREDHMRSCYGLDLIEMSKTGMAWVVMSSYIRHFQPAYAGEVVSIETALIAYDRKLLRVEALMNGSTGPKALLLWSLRCVDPSTGRPREHDAQFMSLCERLVVDDAAGVDFEARCSVFKPQRA